MIASILGGILLFFPFLLITLFKDKKKGFVCILFFSIIFYTVLAFFTQLFGVFYYWVIVLFSFLADIIALGFLWRFRQRISFKIFKIDWVVILVIIIAFLSLWQVHYNYTGKINLATDITVSYHEVKNMEYVYPYFSDEWYAVSLIKHSINYHALPLWNDLNNSFFPNLEMFFHSFVAEIMLILNLDPLTQYTLISILFNVLIICLAYIFLRINKVSKLASAIASLSILYITCGANLPGVWHFIPVHLGIIFVLMGFCFISLDNFFLAGLASLLVIIFYGPLFIFYGPGLFVFAVLKFIKKTENVFRTFSYFFIALFLILPIIYIIFKVFPPGGFLGYVIKKLYYVSYSGLNIPQLFFFDVIPVWSICLFILGLSKILKNKLWLFSIFSLASFCWIFYSFNINRVVIEYERVVFFTSIVVVLISGFGLDWIEGRFRDFKFPVFKYTGGAVLIIFLLAHPFYTRTNNWDRLVLVNSINAVKSYPKSPANKYLTEDDLKIFQDIKNKRFLSIPWKGLVIGISTGNYPVGAKEGTMSAGSIQSVDEFIGSDCMGKLQVAEKEKLDYVYFSGFDCPGFKKINESSEKLILYKIEK